MHCTFGGSGAALTSRVAAGWKGRRCGESPPPMPLGETHEGSRMLEPPLGEESRPLNTGENRKLASWAVETPSVSLALAVGATLPPASARPAMLSPTHDWVACGANSCTASKPFSTPTTSHLSAFSSITSNWKGGTAQTQTRVRKWTATVKARCIACVRASCGWCSPFGSARCLPRRECAVETAASSADSSSCSSWRHWSTQFR